MTILVTGSAGHLGEALMRSLRAAGRSARGVDILASPFTDRVGSIGDRDFVRHALTGVRAVIHAATLHKPHVATHSKTKTLSQPTSRERSSCSRKRPRPASAPSFSRPPPACSARR